MAACEQGEPVGLKLGRFAAVRWLHCGIVSEIDADGGERIVCA
jgi:hypothetical protein